MNQELHTLAYGQKSIEYCILYADRKTLEIAVHPDQSIIVTAPNNADRTIIEQKIKKRIRWIFRQVNYFKQFDPKTPSRKYISGESHLYLGRQYRLKVLQDESNQVKLTRGLVSRKSKDSI